MNYPNSFTIQQVAHRRPVAVLLTAAVLSFFTLLIACVVTVASLGFNLVFGVIRAITRLSFRCIVYILLGILFILGAALGIILSIITLGAISLP